MLEMLKDSLFEYEFNGHAAGLHFSLNADDYGFSVSYLQSVEFCLTFFTKKKTIFKVISVILKFKNKILIK